MTGPIAFIVWDGHGRLPAWRRKLIAAWLTANDINPDDACADRAITILTVPFRPAEAAGDGEPWLIPVITLHQYYVNRHGAKEQNLITRQPVTFQRTVPLKVPFPADTPTADEGARDGEAEGQAAQEAPQEVVRPAREAQISHTGQVACQERPGEGLTERIEGNSEEDPRQDHEEVPKPEEVQRRPEEEVGAE
jgi:hypothetical protein